MPAEHGKYKKKTRRKGVLFTLHVASLGVSNYVGRRAGLFLKCSTLTLCEVGESAEGNALLSLLLWHTFGALHVEFSQPVNLEEVARINPEVKAGGRFAPKDCIALQKVAIIIPFRNREEHLKYWLYYLHPILQRQQLDYGVYVINQDGEEEFNRAKLLNIGFAEALKEYDYDCFVFSDVDLIPMDDRNTYKCYSQPRHLSVSMDKFGFRLPYNQYFGGVSALSKEQFTKINGFPNNYWGWGGEDDDIYNRSSLKCLYLPKVQRFCLINQAGDNLPVGQGIQSKEVVLSFWGTQALRSRRCYTEMKRETQRGRNQVLFQHWCPRTAGALQRACK
uniref:Beta-1,4-galactosyltransferase n=1 Tax=Buteo japonicus TaxID=224669 RepID=A0A8C0BDR5_9AVES